MKTNFKLAIAALTIILFAFQASAQNNIPQVDAGVTLQYRSETPDGQEIKFPIDIVQNDDDGMVMNYTVIMGPNSIGGQFRVTCEGIEKGEKMNWGDLNPGEKRQLAKNETIFMFSQKFLDEIKANKSAEYDGRTYKLAQMPAGTEVSFGDKAVPSIYVEAADGGPKFWIMDNKKYPLILNSTGNDRGPNFTLANITVTLPKGE